VEDLASTEAVATPVVESPPPPAPPRKSVEIQPPKAADLDRKTSEATSVDDDLAQKVALAAALEGQMSAEVNGRRTPPHVKTRPPLGRSTRNRREKSGIPALDKDLSDLPDDEVEMTEPERDEEDDDWDFIEAGDGEDKNGAKATSLWARGVVDRYKLSVFRKSSTPNARSVSGQSKASVATDATESPSPSQRRGRSGINFRKNPRQFLRPKSPPSTFSTGTGRSFSQTVNSLSTATTSNGFLTPATNGMSPSLKSKESAVSMGAQSASSDQSGNIVSPSIPSANNGGPEDLIAGLSKGSPSGEQEKSSKNKKLRKVKHNAEKVFSLFSSPKPPQVPSSSQS
jgi:hypothetical protein